MANLLNPSKTRIKILHPRSTLTLQEQTRIRVAAQDEAFAQSVKLAFGDMNDLFLAEPEPVVDFGCALSQWNTAALAVINTNYSVFQAVAAPAVAAGRVYVWFGCSVETAGFPVSRLIFAQGAAAGTTYASFDLEKLANEQEPVGFFSEPIVYVPPEVMNIVVTARIATGLIARVQLFGYYVERKGGRISN